MAVFFGQAEISARDVDLHVLSKSSKKEYQPPPVRGTSPKRFKPGGDKPKEDYTEQLAESMEKSE